MNRRNFLKFTGTSASVAPLVLNSIPVRSFATSSLMQGLDCTTLKERALVVIQLFGGNDGLNTLIPIDQYASYAKLRPTLRIPESGSKAYVNLDESLSIENQVGLNPHIPEFKELYDQGLASFIQGVGYPNHTRSHFKSTDLILSGTDSTIETYSYDSGWAGRYLDHAFPGLAGYSSPVMPDPLGIQMGILDASLAFSTPHSKTHINLGGKDNMGFYSQLSGIGGCPVPHLPLSEYGELLSHANSIQSNTSNFCGRIGDLFEKGSNAKSYPDLDLANQLKTVARLMDGGCQTKIYWVYLSGFDTHSSQANMHAKLLRELSLSIKAFQDDLKALGLEKRVLTLTLSEFGRKAYENGSKGTDHGTSSSMYLFGAGLKGGVYGTNINLADLEDGAPKAPQYDYRQVLTTLLTDWLGADSEAQEATGFSSFENQKLDLVSSNQVADPSFYCEVDHYTIGEVGNLTGVSQANRREWHTVKLDKMYTDPVVIMGTPSSGGSQPLTIRVRNITSSSFEWQVREWDYLDGKHDPIDISYWVMETGVHQLPNGIQIVAGNTGNEVGQNWRRIAFEQVFEERPIVFAQCSSCLYPQALVCRTKEVFSDSFYVRLQGEEGGDISELVEQVSWVAVAQGEFSEGIPGESGLIEYVSHRNKRIPFSSTYREQSSFFAHAQTFNGADPFSIRCQHLDGEQAISLSRRGDI